MLTAIAIRAIKAYRRYLSPYKGFSCSYRVHTGGGSCSAHGLRVVERYGIARGSVLLRRRLRRCADVHAQTSAERHYSYHLRHQRGACDVAEGACEAANTVADTLTCCGDCSNLGKKLWEKIRRRNSSTPQSDIDSAE